jgi:hypothetical protein
MVEVKVGEIEEEDLAKRVMAAINATTSEGFHYNLAFKKGRTVLEVYADIKRSRLGKRSKPY